VSRWLCRQGVRWKFGYGFNIPVISEPLIGARSSIPLIGPDMMALQPYLVGQLIDQNAKAWNEQLVRSLSVTETSQNILNTPLH